MIKHLILGGLCHIHSTVSGPLHYLHSPLAVSSRNSADPELSSPWHSARQRIWDASSTEPWAEVQHVSTDSKIFQTQKRRHTTSCESHCLIWIWWSGGRLVIHFLGPRWTQEDCPKAESIGSGSSNINVWTKPANRCHWHAEHIQAHRLPFCHQQLVQGIKETCG